MQIRTVRDRVVSCLKIDTQSSFYEAGFQHMNIVWNFGVVVLALRSGILSFLDGIIVIISCMAIYDH
jgi:hypothetical protein